MATTTLPLSAIRARRTTVAMKIVMACTGILFVLFVLMHMYGNLKAFGGADAYNEYAEHLRTILMPIAPFGGVLWVVRVVLFASVVLHVWSAAYLWGKSRDARGPQGYAVKRAVAASLSSRFMRWGGAFLLLFIIFHLLEFTTLTINVGGVHDTPYARLVAGFQHWWLLVIYLLAMVALFMHIAHGVWSAGQTLGLTGTPHKRAVWKGTGHTLAAVIAIGFSIVPICILAGIIK